MIINTNTMNGNMNLCQLSLATLYLCLLITITVVTSNPTYFTVGISINCGSSKTSAARSGKEWQGDIQPRFSASLQLKGSSMISTVIHKLTSADPVPHKTARLSRSQFSYLFQVNPGQKIIRLHFNSATYRGFEGIVDLFSVEAGPFTLLSDFSASLTADALGLDTFVKEFSVNIQENQHLIISFSPKSSQTLDTYAFINGIEIIGGYGVLASSNPLPPAQVSPSQIIRAFLASLVRRNATAAIVITIVSLLSIIVHKLREIWEDSSTEEENKPSPKAARFCRRFSLAEIQQATRYFCKERLIGRGGFGNVYRGLIDEGQTTVAIKKLNPNSMQGAREFLTEIETLSELRHVNLVSLIGYCNEHGEMILVYDYMAGGTLGNHIYKPSRKRRHISSLTWKQRLNICIGAGRGLDYLHTGHGVIHRDVKASNILLDEDLVAKVSDFGLAKPEDGRKLQTHVSTNVKGTRGYLDPHYFHTRKLTRKSDTYAFGVVLFEVLCGRPAVDLGVTEDEQILSMWAQDKNSKGEVDQIVDLNLRDEISPDSLKIFVELAERCLEDEPNNRPTMSQVVQQLELALEQQESKRILASNETSSSYEETGQSADSGQSSVSNIELQILTCTPKGQTSHQVADTKVSRFWSRNRSNSSRETELLLSEIREANLKVTVFDWHTLSVATNRFSSSNEVGKGGFGHVYKGVLPTGQVVAVKRHSTSPAQSLKEFKNEILLLPNLHHQNVIKLLGYCIHGRESLLVYEFMENISLDTFIGDKKRQHFPWPVRFNIIKGIARGLVYLHQGSRFRVIHGDPKSSNILLDHEMVPKISDFGFSMKLLEHDSELETGIAAGTNFGVVILEIVSGHTAWRSYTLSKMNIHDYARKLRSDGKVLDLVDGSLGGEFPADEALRCIRVGLRCTLEHPHDRPSMRSVLKMLEKEAL
ncbi:receptor-like protein kinase FERONIA isoform X2 [Salvia miltiorrhiza]|uniref:receptor-like protein kinase FERONIA isoform X2 n=2 Tax=Salvia miltiorrhiza TaxID=226208 RepID=UPI0025ABD44D|nr:receptor-like protein kinase FERONIA isoform X2 [Salvia miltiorrhiza]